MPSNELLEFSKSINMPVEDVINSFAELKTSGYIFTMASTAKEMIERKYPFRLAGSPPSGLEKSSEVSFGPFSIDRETYDHLKLSLTDSDTFRVFLGIVRLAYEKTGGIIKGYNFEATEDDLDHFLAMMEFWDVENPFICDNFVWILPNEKGKEYVEKLLDKNFAKNDYTWWNIRLDLGEKFIPSTLEDYPDSFSLLPTELFGPWASFLPITIHVLLMRLYLLVTLGGEFKSFKTLTEIINKIEEFLSIEAKEGALISSSITDRELLIKELCDFNNLPYPIDSNTAFDYLCRTGFLKIKQIDNHTEYVLVQEVQSPETVLQIPEGWEERKDKFISTGSILFSYLSLDEIVE